MNCPKCGNILPQNAYFCPVCNEPVAQQAAYPYADAQQQTGQNPPVNPYGAYQQPQAGYQQPYPQQGYQQPQAGYQPPYQQSYAQYGARGSYPPGYQPPFVYGQPGQSASNKFLSALSDLPRAFLDSFTKPAEVLRKLMEGQDRLTGLIVAGIVLLMSFLCGMALARGAVSLAFSGLSSLTGVSLAGDAASFNQGVSYVTGRIAPAVGGVAALCQLLGTLCPAAVAMVYLCAVCKARFSWELLLGFTAVTSLPTAAISLAMILLSFLSPWLSLVAMLCGWAVSYAQMGALMEFVTGRTQAQLFPAKIACYSIGILLTSVLVALVGGALMSGVLNRMVTLLANVGSLI